MSSYSGGSIEIADVLGRIRSKGVSLWSQNGELHYRAPAGALTRAEIETLKSSRRQIIALLQAAWGGDEAGWELAPRASCDSAPLTYAQLAHWQSARLSERSHVRTVTAATCVRGRLDAALLRESLAHVIRRHEALRTRIVVLDGVPAQHVVADADPCNLVTDDLAALSPRAREAEVLRSIQRLILEPIRVTVGPLFELRLARLGPDEHVLIVAMEHIISDAFSLNILLRDLLTTYLQASAGRSASLPEIPIQPADYAVWQRNTRRSWLDRHAGYWSERLNGCERLSFPSDVVGAADRPGWGTIPMSIDAALKSELREWCRFSRTTLVMSVFTAYAALVLRWCRASEAVIRYQTDGRFSPKIANSIGYFASMLHLRVQLREHDDFLDLVQRVTQEYCTAYEHHDHSYIEAQVPPSQFARNGCFNWVSQEPSSDALAPTDVPRALTTEPMRFTNPLLANRIHDAEPVVLLRDAPQEIIGEVYFALNRFSPALMERFARNLLVFIRVLVGQPDTRIRDIRLQ